MSSARQTPSKAAPRQGPGAAVAEHPLSESLIELICHRFRVLSEPMRLRLLDRLREGEATVGELQEALGASQQNVSKHLAVLREAGAVSRSKEGTSSVYSISDPTLFELCELVCGQMLERVGELDQVLRGQPAVQTTTRRHDDEPSP